VADGAMDPFLTIPPHVNQFVVTGHVVEPGSEGVRSRLQCSAGPLPARPEDPDRQR
jgi:hypothetical protein